jgi:hypothetical protein
MNVSSTIYNSNSPIYKKKSPIYKKKSPIYKKIIEYIGAIGLRYEYEKEDYSEVKEIPKVKKDNSEVKEEEIKLITIKGCNRVIYLFSKNINIGYFSIKGLYKNPIFNPNLNPNEFEKSTEIFDSGNTCHMNITIDNSYKNKSLSYVMIYLMICNIYLDYPTIKDTQALYIDGDGSDKHPNILNPGKMISFWDGIGMTSNPICKHDKMNREGCGYDKVITFGELTKVIYRKIMKLLNTHRNNPRNTHRNNPRNTPRNTPRKLTINTRKTSIMSQFNRTNKNHYIKLVPLRKTYPLRSKHLNNMENI